MILVTTDPHFNIIRRGSRKGHTEPQISVDHYIPHHKSSHWQRMMEEGVPDGDYDYNYHKDSDLHPLYQPDFYYQQKSKYAFEMIRESN